MITIVKFCQNSYQSNALNLYSKLQCGLHGLVAWKSSILLRVWYWQWFFPNHTLADHQVLQKCTKVQSLGDYL